MPTAIVRPTGRVGAAASGLTYNGGAFEATAAILSDNSDSSYIGLSTCPAPCGSGFTLDMGTVTVAANQKIFSVQLSVRNARDASSTKTQTSSWYALSGDNTQQTPTYSNNRSSNTITTNNGPVWNQLGNKIWTQTVLNNFRIVGTLYADSTGSGQRVYDIWCTVTYLTQPAVTGTPSVTGFVNNARPTVSWTFLDPDGTGSQYGYRVKIFTAAAIAGGTFDPETTTPAWDSGDVTSSAASALSDALQNGVTYTAYVKVAKLNNDQLTYWWSSWATSATFTPSFTPPTPPVISNLRLLAEESRYRTVMDVFAPTNLLTANAASLETDANDWVALLNNTRSRSTTQALHGVASLQMSSTAAGTMQAITNSATALARVDKGVTYTALASFRAATVGRTVNVGIRWLKNDKSTIVSTTFGANATDTTTGWVQATYTVAAPDGAVYAQVVVQVVSTAAGAEIHYVDQVDIHAGSGTTWTVGGLTNFDASTSTFYNGTYVERRECVDARRGPANNWFSRQIASAGAALSSPSAGFWWDTANSTVENVWLSQLLGQPGYVASGALRWTNVVGAAGQHLDFGNDLATTDWRYAPSVVPNQAHTFSCWSWTDTGTRVVTPQITWLDSTGAVISTSNASNATLTTAPQHLICTATAPANAVYAYGRLLDTASTVSPHMFVSTIGFGLGTMPVDDNEPMGLNQAVWTKLQYSGTNTNPLYNTAAIGYATGQTETIPDFEVPPVRPVVYRASVTYFDPNSSNTIISGYSNYVPAYAAVPARTLLQSVTDPILGSVVNRRKTLGSAYTFDAQVFHPLGADSAPIQVRDWSSGEDATIEVALSSETQMQRLNRLLVDGGTLMIDWGQGGRTYVLITGVSLQETASADSTVCDADGTVGHLRYVIASLAYIETVGPNVVS